jgi:hypothetical protein
MRATLEKLLCAIGLFLLAGLIAGLIAIGATFTEVWVGILVTQLVTMCALLMLILADFLLIRLLINSEEAAGAPAGGQQSAFPLLADSLRSNSRSSPLFAVLYMLLFSLIFLLVILTFAKVSSPAPKLTFVSRPTSFTIGTILAPVSVAVTKDGEPVEGEAVRMSIYPLDPIPIIPSLNNEASASRTVNCMRSMLDLQALHGNDDKYFCGPWIFEEKTDKHGIAAFDLIVVPSGAPVSYAFMAYAVSRPTASVMDVVQAHFTFLHVSFSSPVPLGSSDMVLGAAHSFEASALVASARKPTILVAAVLPIFVSAQDTEQTWMPFGATDAFGDAAAIIENAQAASSRIVKVSKGNGDMDAVWNVTFAFRDVKILAVSSIITTFALAVSSAVVPISSVDFSVLGTTTPETLAFPFASQPNAAADVAVVRTMTIASGRVVEGESFAFFAELAGPSSTDRYGFLMLEPAVGIGSSATFTAEHPSTAPKELVNSVCRIPAGQTTADCSSVFSVSGAVGSYLLHFLVGGRSATWPGGATGAPLSVRVTSSVVAVKYAYPAALVDETVGVEWKVLPVVTMLDATGGPVIGKLPVLATADASGNNVGLTFDAISSGSDGNAFFLSVRVGFARNIAPLSSAQLSFNLLVDGVLRGTLRRRLTQPPRLPSSCSFVRFDTLPTTMRGVSSFTVVALDLYGSPVPKADVRISAQNSHGASVGVSEKASTVNDETVSTTITDSTGRATLFLTSTSTGVAGVSVEASCNRLTTPFNTIATLVFKSSVAFASSVDLGDGSVEVTELLADWSLVSPSAPITLSAVVVFAPAYIDQFLGPDNIPRFQTVSVTSASDLPIVLTVSSPAVVPTGFYSIVIIADGLRVGFATMNVATYDYELSLQRSAFDGSSFAFGVVNAQQPAVLVERGGNAVAGAMVYAQLMYSDEDEPVLTNGQLQDVVKNPASIFHGFVFTEATLDDETFAVAVTDVNGIADFSNLIVSNVPHGTNVSLRYCIASGIVLGISMCASDTGFAVYTGASVILNSSSLSLVGSPGSIVENIITVNGMIDNDAVSAMRCTAFATLSGSSTIIDNFLRFYEPTQEMDAYVSNRVFISSGGAQQFKLGIGATASDGLYTTHISCSGGSLSLPIIVSRSAFTVNFDEEPAATVTIENVDSVEVEVRSPGGPLPNAVVGLRVRLPCEESVCEDSVIPCGIIRGRTVAKTNKDGRATLSYYFESAPTGPFVIDAFVMKSTTPEFRSNSLASGIDDVEALTGISVAKLAGLMALSADQAALTHAATMRSTHPAELESVPCEDADDNETASSSSAAAFEGFAEYANVPAQKEIATEEHYVTVKNEVATIAVQLQRDLTMQLPQQIQGFAAKPATLSVEQAAAPRLLLLNMNGDPVVNASVELTWLSPSSANATVDYPLTLKSDAAGLCIVFPLTLRAETSGEYSLVFSSKGAGAASIPVKVLKARVLSRDQAMKLAAYILFGLCTPLFLLLVPHSRLISFLITAVIVVGIAVVVYFYGGIQEVLTSIGSVDMSPYVIGYFNLVIALFATVLAGFAVLLLVKLLSNAIKGRMQIADDEMIAERRFKYVKWLINVRLSKQQPVEESEMRQMPPTASASPPSAKCAPRPLVYDASVDPTVVPVTVWAALGVGALFVACSIIFLLYIRDNMLESLRGLAEYFPSTDAFDDFKLVNLTVEDLMAGPIGPLLNAMPESLRANATAALDQGITGAEQNINKAIGRDGGSALRRVSNIVIVVLTELLGFLAKKFPQLGTIAPLLANLQETNLLDILGKINSLLRSIISTVSISFIVAMVVSLVLMMINGITILLNVKKISAAMRQGRFVFDKPPSAIVISPYVPCHAFHFLVMHQLVFWILFIVVFLLSWDRVRQIIYTVLLQVVLPAVVSGALMKMLQNKILQHFFLATDQTTVVRPELFSFWVLFSVASSSIAAVGLTIARFFMYIVAGAVCFCRLDFSIYPRPLAFMDGPHSQFISVVAMEVRASNPIVLLFSAMLLCGRRARERVQQDEAEPVPLYELLSGQMTCGCRATLSGGLINMAAQYGRMLSDRQQPLEGNSRSWDTTKYYGPDLKRWYARNRVANRLWLAVLLMQNPSLCQLRKVTPSRKVLTSTSEPVDTMPNKKVD